MPCAALEPEALFEVVLGVFDCSSQRLAPVTLPSSGDTDVVFVGDTVELSVELTDEGIIEAFD